MSFFSNFLKYLKSNLALSNQKKVKMKNLISWVEIPATDFQRAVNFYRTAFQLDLEIVDYGEEKMACLPEGEGAISQASDFHPSKDGVIVNFNTRDQLEQTIERIEKAGGKIIQSKTKIEAEGRGYFALFQDSEGNRLGLFGNE
jgi:hypothetical protein